MRFTFLSFFCAAVLSVGPLSTTCSAQNDSPASSDILRLGTCSVQLIKDIEVPARETGLLKELFVQPNDAVQLSQLLGRIDDQVSQRLKEQASFRHTLAKEQSEDENQIKMAERKMLLTREEYNVNLKLADRKSKSIFEVNRSRFQMEIAELEHTAAIKDKYLAGIKANEEMVNLAAAEDSIARHQVVSPSEGFVLEVFKDAGEWVQAGEKVLRIAPMSQLHVHGSVDYQKHDPHELEGKPVTVTMSRAGGTQVQFTGRVARVNLEVSGEEYGVVAEIDNRVDQAGRYQLLPGLYVEMQIHLNGSLPERTAFQGGQ